MTRWKWLHFLKMSSLWKSNTSSQSTREHLHAHTWSPAKKQFYEKPLTDFSVGSRALICHFTALDFNIMSWFQLFMTLAQGHREDVKPCPGILFQQEIFQVTQHILKVLFCGDTIHSLNLLHVKNINTELGGHVVWCNRFHLKSSSSCRCLCVCPLYRDIWSLGCVLYELCTLRHPVSCITPSTSAAASHTQLETRTLTLMLI